MQELAPVFCDGPKSGIFVASLDWPTKGWLVLLPARSLLALWEECNPDASDNRAAYSPSIMRMMSSSVKAGNTQTPKKRLDSTSVRTQNKSRMAVWRSPTVTTRSTAGAPVNHNIAAILRRTQPKRRARMQPR